MATTNLKTDSKCLERTKNSKNNPKEYSTFEACACAVKKMFAVFEMKYFKRILRISWSEK